MQYLDNRQVYGYIAFGEGHNRHVADGIERAKELLGNDHAENCEIELDSVRGLAEQHA